MSDSLFQRAEILLGQQRFDEASEVLSNLMAQDPNDPDVLSMLSEVSLQKGHTKDALSVIDNAIRLAPDDDTLHFQKARILLNMEQYDTAEKSLDNAITYNPLKADYFAVWSSIKLARKHFEEALKLTSQALSIDGENLLALNNRSKALLKLNRTEESSKTIEGALHKDPNNAYTHTTIGWNELERGDHKKALKHFKEALKQDPNFQYAQAGMIEALKAKYWVYRVFLKYVFWSSNLTSKYQWGFIIGLYIGTRGLSTLSEKNPTLAPFLNPIVMLLVCFALSTWVTAPLSNLFLRLNFYGKHLLSKKEKMSSNLVGVCAIILFSGIIGVLVSNHPFWIGLAIYGLTLMIPCSAMFSSAKQKYVLPLYTIAMAVIGILALLYTLRTEILMNTFATAFIIGVFAFQWLANFIIIRENKI